MYNAADMLTIMRTEESIKKHAYDSAKKALTGVKKERNIFMTKHGDSPATKKTIHELAKEFPDKTYRELEKYREEDRQQEAGICIMGEMRKDREEFEPGLEEQVEILKKELDLERECSQAGYLENKKLLKRAQEAEGELTIVKTITIDSSPEMRDAKKEIEELKKKVRSLKWIKDHDYIFLVDENKKLHAEIKKLKEGAVDRARKAGL